MRDRWMMVSMLCMTVAAVVVLVGILGLAARVLDNTNATLSAVCMVALADGDSTAQVGCSPGRDGVLYCLGVAFSPAAWWSYSCEPGDSPQ